MGKSHAVVESPRVPRRGPYSQAVQLGELIFVAGQAGLSPATGAVAGTTFELQARQAFENLRAVLEDAGSGLDRVVKTTCFPVAPPARSTPLVQLPRGLLFSIEAVAAVGPDGGTA